jgi:hypothetical protein
MKSLFFLKMKQNSFYLASLIILCTFFFAVSCEKSPVDATASNPNQRLEFIKGKTMPVLKADYSKISSNDAKNLWVNKLQQIQTQSLNDMQRQLIQDLQTELLQQNSLFRLENEKIREIAIQLATVTPREAFLQMFESLENYNYNGSNTSTAICEECVTDLRNYKPVNLPIVDIEQRAPVCNCRWTCDWYSLSPTRDCRLTMQGCGFFWLSTCTMRY